MLVPWRRRADGASEAEGEARQVFGRLGGVRYAALIILFGVLAGLLGAFGSRQQASSAAEDPRFHVPVRQEARSTLSRRLRWRTWFEILVVGLAVSGGFLALGVLMVGETLTHEWATLGKEGEASLRIYDLGVGSLVASEPLLRLVGGHPSHARRRRG